MKKFSKQKSIFLFLTLCIGARVGLVLLSKYLPKKWLQIMGYVTLLPGIGFLYLYFTNSRLNAGEAGGKTWWHNIRIIHGCLYILFSILAIHKKKKAWMVLLADVSFGLIMFVNHHFLRII